MALRVALIVGAYLLGTFPTATLVAGAYGRDVAAEGSGNPGASNVYRLAGARAGLVVFLGDLAKGALATVLGMLITGDRVVGVACGIAAVIGHCFPVFRRFQGGKGVATAGGVVTAMAPLVAIPAAIVWLLVARVVGKASLASLTVIVGVPLALWLLDMPGDEFAGVGVLAALVLLRHTENIVRLVKGEERTIDAVPGERTTP